MAQAALLNLHCKYYDFLGAKKLADQMLKEAANNSIQDESWLDMVNGALRVYSELNCHQEMEQLKTLILALDCEMPPSSPKWALKGRVAFENRHLGYAEECFEAAKHTALVDADAYKANFGLAICCYAKAHYSKANDIFQTLERSNLNIEVKVATLIWLAQTGSLVDPSIKPLEILREAKTLSKQDGNHYLWIQTLISEAEALLFLGKTEEANDILRLAEHLIPNGFYGRSHQKIDNAKAKITQSLNQIGFNLMESDGRVYLTTPTEDKIDLTTQPLLIMLICFLGSTPESL